MENETKQKQKRKSREDCLALLDEIRWARGFLCPTCGGTRSYPIRSRGLLQCRECGKQVSATSGTILHGARNLDIWLKVIQSFALDSNRTAASLARELNIRYATVWLILQKLRAALLQETDFRRPISIIDCDHLLRALFKWSKETSSKTIDISNSIDTMSQDEEYSTAPQLSDAPELIPASSNLTRELTNHFLFTYFGISRKYAQLYVAEHWLRNSINQLDSRRTIKQILGFFLRAGPGRKSSKEIDLYRSPVQLVYPQNSFFTDSQNFRP